MIKRRNFLIALGAGPLYAAAARAQTPERAGRPVRVGILATTTQATNQVFERPFVDTLRNLGWVEGRNVVYDRLYADDDETRLPALAAALVARSPDLIYTPNLPPTVAAFAKTRTIPIVFAAVGDPVGLGLIRNLAHPGGNVTGIANIGWELGGKRLQLLKQALPKIARVGVLVNPVQPDSRREQKLIEQAAATLGVTAIPVMVKEAKELDAAFAPLAKSRAEALLTTHTYLFVINQRKNILALAAKQPLPVIGPRGEFAEEGALMSYGSILSEQVRRAAQLADKILKGTKPADIPAEQPTKFELVVNLKTAKALGLTVSKELLFRADKVIECSVMPDMGMPHYAAALQRT